MVQECWWGGIQGSGIHGGIHGIGHSWPRVNSEVNTKHRICRGAVTGRVTAKLHFCAGCFQRCNHGIRHLLDLVNTRVNTQTAVLDWLPRAVTRKPRFSDWYAKMRYATGTRGKRHLLKCWAGCQKCLEGVPEIFPSHTAFHCAKGLHQHLRKPQFWSGTHGPGTQAGTHGIPVLLARVETAHRWWMGPANRVSAPLVSTTG